MSKILLSSIMLANLKVSGFLLTYICILTLRAHPPPATLDRNSVAFSIKIERNNGTLGLGGFYQMIPYYYGIDYNTAIYANGHLVSDQKARNIYLNKMLQRGAWMEYEQFSNEDRFASFPDPLGQGTD